MLIHRLTPGSSRPVAMGTGTAIVGACLLATASLPEAARAHTTAATVTCAGSQTVAYSPGLSSRHRQVTIHGTTTLDRCVSTTGSTKGSTTGPGITAARSTFRATGRLSCTSGGYSGTRKIRWNNGRTSTMSFTSAVSVDAGRTVVAIRGEVTDGEFSGQRWSAAFTMFTAKPEACATSEGLPTAAGRVLLSIGSNIPGTPVLETSRPSRH
jgi:hypothetical protein